MHIIILVTGTGGMPAANELCAELSKSHSIIAINASETFQFVPSNLRKICAQGLGILRLK